MRAVRFNLHRGGSLDERPADLELVAEIAPAALADNARAWYRPRA